ncbi:glycoside hydrolase family 26 protein [Kitasatospora sp. NPDC056531]|uniref:glycoside hydrolase family 26 protein n=1 Tax=Kitasatospora sp. NPDC056531 TaxID=3345856 RepID=UPI00369526F5
MITRTRRTRLIRAGALAVAGPLLAVGCGPGAPTATPAVTPASTGSAAPGASAAPAPPYDVSALRKPGGRMLGVAAAGEAGDLAPVAAFAAKAGRAPDVREYYYDWGQDFDGDGTAALWQNGQLPLMVWTPTNVPLSRIVSGAEDDYLRSFAKGVRSYPGPLAISFAPEMNADWSDWGPSRTTSADFVQAWRHIHDVFRDQQAVNVLWVWAPHANDMDRKVPLRPYYPGDDYVDWLGLVGYYGPTDGTAYSSLFTPTVKSLRAFSDKPLLISETAVAEGPKKSAQIDDLFAGAAGTDGLIGLVWFDVNGRRPGVGPTDWRVDSSPAAAKELVYAAAHAGFGWSPASARRTSSG